MRPIGGMMMSLTSELTTVPRAVPMITPMARARALVFNRNARNPLNSHPPTDGRHGKGDQGPEALIAPSRDRRSLHRRQGRPYWIRPKLWFSAQLAALTPIWLPPMSANRKWMPEATRALIASVFMTVAEWYHRVIGTPAGPPAAVPGEVILRSMSLPMTRRSARPAAP